MHLATKQFVDDSVNSIDVTELTKKKTNCYDFIDKKLVFVRIVKVDSHPALGGHLTLKTYVDSKKMSQVSQIYTQMKKLTNNVLG